MAERPGLVGKIVAYMRHEVSAAVLEAYRRTGRIVYELDERLEHARLEAMVAHGHPMAFPESTQAALLCGWNAYVLQIVGDLFVTTDFEHDPLTVGFVDKLVAEQAILFYGQVPRWVSRAEQARNNPGFHLDVSVPVPLPDWPDGTPGIVYLTALIEGLDRVRRVAAHRLAEETPFADVTAERQAFRRIRALLSEASVAADYARGLRAGVGEELDEAVIAEAVTQARAGLERAYLAGQLVAMPELTLEPLPRTTRLGRRPLAAAICCPCRARTASTPGVSPTPAPHARTTATPKLAGRSPSCGPMIRTQSER